MSNRFTNTEFFATLSGIKRRPVATNQTTDPGDVGNPDPGGDGGGGQNPGGDQGGGDQGTGGDIGNPTGSGGITLGDAPTLTRKSHNVDVFAQSGLEMVVTYVASEPCTMLPKLRTPDMDVSYSVDGQEMTIRWTPAVGLPGDSFRIGCEAHKYGAENEEAISDIYDRVHLNKTSEDIKRIGVGTSWPIIMPGLLRSDIKAGDTIIINDGTYSDANDFIGIGYYSGGGIQGENLVTPNGVSDGTQSMPAYDGAGVEIGTQEFIKITKYTTIMAESLGGVIIDKAPIFGGSPSISITGQYRFSSRDGFRPTHGFAVDGICFRYAQRSLRDQRADGTRFRNISYIGDVDLDEYNANYGAPGSSDGGFLEPLSAGNSTYDYINAITNHRAGVSYGFGAPSTLGATIHSATRRSIVTMGCVRAYNQGISQSFLVYGARSTDFLNCWAIDGGFFSNGFQGNFEFDAPVADSDHFAFQSTNVAGDDLTLDGCMMLKDSRSGWNKSADPEQMRSRVRNSVFFDKFNAYSDDAMFRGGLYDLENVTAGKNSLITFQQGATFDDNDSVNHRGCIALYSSWDYPKAATDTIANGSAELGVDTRFVFAPTAADAGYLSDVDNYLVVTEANIKTSGLQYLGRIDEGTTVGAFDSGCANIFAEVGSYLDEPVSDAHRSYIRYDGRGGRKYINWASNAPWRLWRRERSFYSTTVDGVEYTGNVGMFADGVHPTDYVNRQGTSPLHPTNCPYVDDIYGYVDGSKAIIRWRPVCPAYRATITGYDLYIDGILVAADQDKGLTSFEFESVASGTRLFTVVVKDPVHGNSGQSRTVFLTIP